MTFHTGHEENLVFPAVRTSTTGHMVGACVVVFLVALLYEGLRVYMSWLQTCITTQHGHGEGQGRQSMWVLGIIHTTSYLVQLFIGYCLMLIFMSLNVWLCVALLLGAATGFVLFRFPPSSSRVLLLFTRARGRNRSQGGADDSGERRAIKGEQSQSSVSGYEKLEDFGQRGSEGKY